MSRREPFVSRIYPAIRICRGCGNVTSTGEMRQWPELLHDQYDWPGKSSAATSRLRRPVL